MEIRENREHVGVIVGRFQVAELHDAHKALIDFVITRHEKVMIVLGLAEVLGTREDPLDFEDRKEMILDEYEVAVHYAYDVDSDEVWCRALDKLIGRQLKPGQTVALYGGRDSFIRHYEPYGRYPTYELESKTFFNTGTEARQQIAFGKNEIDVQWRRGKIANAYERFPTGFPTVDTAIFNEDATRILLIRKKDSKAWQLPGGFFDPEKDANLEATSRRESEEETGVAITDPEYLLSDKIPDWRYKRGPDCIITSLFKAKYLHGPVRPGDDAEEANWFAIAELAAADVQPNHHPLVLAACGLRRFKGDTQK
jgi:bifunctional NMN adenylyltransferase/nudix hydrolase